MQTENRCLKRQWRNRERGVAIFLVIFALLLLSAIAFSLIYSTNTETGVNWNYRQEEMAYFAARAGMEEARDRMGIGGQVPPGPGGIAPAPCPLPQCLLPTATPDQAGGFILYLINQGTDPTPVTPWVAGSTYMDDELCHDNYTIRGNWVKNATSPGVRCTDLPPGNTNWQQSMPSNLTNVIGWGAGDALAYKWARVAMKENISVAYGDPAVGGPQNYYAVDPVQAATPQGAAQPVCYDGVTERVPPLALGVTSCAGWANLVPPVYANPVYLITSMGVTGSGARKVVQAEVGLAPSPPLPYGLFATATGCGALTFTGNAYTDSFNSANGTYAQTVQANSGDIGSFGSTQLGGNANIQGIVGVTGTTYTPTVGPCTPPGPTNGVSGNGNNWKDQGIQAFPPTITPASFPTPPAPNPPPPTTNISPSGTLPPGNYGNISISGGTLTLTPGVYNINSLTASGKANIVVNPLGQVVINIAGQGGGTVLSLTGQSVLNPSGIAGDFTVNYAGTGTIKLAGQGQTYFVVNAPNAAVTVTGNGEYFGALIGNTVNYAGNGAWHFDRNVAFKPQSNQNYTMLSFREVAY